MADNTPDNSRPTTPTSEDQPNIPDAKSKRKGKRKRLGNLATMVFIGLSGLSGGFIIGERTRPAEFPPPQSPVIVLVNSQQETRNLSDTLRHTLKKVADRVITLDEAVDQVADVLQIRLTDTELIEQIRQIVQKVMEAATNDSVQEGLDALVKLLEQMSKPSPSPIPTATIVFPRNK